jgi:hypothetical protein
MADSNSDRDPVEAIADEFMARKRSGENPSIEEYAQAYPNLADDIRELFPTLLMMETYKPTDESSDARHVVHEGETKLAVERLGDFQILREIGRGGMGVVYEAEQISLGRHVALKVLPQRMLSSDVQISRFEREARAAARLHHTNIVPVFGVGQDHGYHFYAMQFIHGHGLDDVLEELRRFKGPHFPDEVRESAVKSAEQSSSGSADALAQSLLTGRFSLGSQTASENKAVPKGVSQWEFDETAKGRQDSTPRFAAPSAVDAIPQGDDKRGGPSDSSFSLQNSESGPRHSGRKCHIGLVLPGLDFRLPKHFSMPTIRTSSIAILNQAIFYSTRVGPCGLRILA